MSQRIFRSNVAERITRRDVKTSEGIVPYDFDNFYPNRTDDVVNASGTGSSCLGLLSLLYEGKGLNDEAFYKEVVNDKGLKMDSFHRSVSVDFAKRNGIAIHVNYNANYQKTEVQFIPFGDCRKVYGDVEKYKGMIAVYPDWGRRMRFQIKQDDIQYIDRYNPDPKVIAEQVAKAGGWEKYKGQIYWYSSEGEAYPKALYDSVIFDMESEGRIASHTRKKAATGGNADVSITLVGEYTEPEIKNYANEVERNMGDDAAGNVTITAVSTIEQKPIIEPYPKSDAKNDFYAINDSRVQANIRRNFRFSPVLIGDFITGFGVSQATIESLAFVNAMTYSKRLQMEEIYTEVFSNWFRPINSKNDFTIIEFSIEFPAITPTVNQLPPTDKPAVA